ncbi:MAG: redox-sensing transcriptional repressor Rex [Candidatus Krumholzibacteria bacterium]|nr:redox-sensing transcriptional repressor Rex [Candidatus Krumholzibacteria bacterium]MDP6668418.1 redox-sensing transcriptional repressor Rex [Candidatus Krumholzibacteria bacterium]MDP6797987.1 redox-sensing transcriptional repressor Rex [Candidatus Krumholzibacteria bacterium]MDP7021858.1 redox-sensing transcriptional repressor Rex [Candidatus Krumholzibacteria bacterium]
MPRSKQNRKVKGVPEATILRLPLYLNRLRALQRAGAEQVSSRELADGLQIKAGQLRHDLHHFGGFSRPGHPYEVDALILRLIEVMKLGHCPYIIAGVGQLGQAIANYTHFDEYGFRLKGLFDVNPRIQGMLVRDIPVRGLLEMDSFIRKEKIEMGVLAVPPSAAQDVVDRMVKAGIRGIWNFAPVELETSPDVVVQEEFLSVSLMALNFKMKSISSGS